VYYLRLKCDVFKDFATLFWSVTVQPFPNTVLLVQIMSNSVPKYMIISLPIDVSRCCCVAEAQKEHLLEAR
jgi:hypothetical protein